MSKLSGHCKFTEIVHIATRVASVWNSLPCLDQPRLRAGENETKKADRENTFKPARDQKILRNSA